MSFFEILGIIIDDVKDLGKGFQDMNEEIKNDFDEIFFDKSSQIETRRPASAQYGDVICVQKPGYYHYGIYINDNRIIHFAPQNEFDSLLEAMEHAVIHETTIKGFLGSGHKLYVCDFTKYYSEPSRRSVKYNLPETSVVGDPVGNLFNSKLFSKIFEYKVYSSSETVERALSKIGQTKYNLAFNNCEHFAIWCKTGIKESHQVNKILEGIKPININ